MAAWRRAITGHQKGSGKRGGGAKRRRARLASIRALLVKSSQPSSFRAARSSRVFAEPIRREKLCRPPVVIQQARSRPAQDMMGDEERLDGGEAVVGIRPELGG